MTVACHSNLLTTTMPGCRATAFSTPIVAMLHRLAASHIQPSRLRRLTARLESTDSDASVPNRRGTAFLFCSSSCSETLHLHGTARHTNLVSIDPLLHRVPNLWGSLLPKAVSRNKLGRTFITRLQETFQGSILIHCRLVRRRGHQSRTMSMHHT